MVQISNGPVPGGLSGARLWAPAGSLPRIRREPARLTRDILDRLSVAKVPALKSEWAMLFSTRAQPCDARHRGADWSQRLPRRHVRNVRQPLIIGSIHKNFNRRVTEDFLIPLRPCGFNFSKIAFRGRYCTGVIRTQASYASFRIGDVDLGCGASSSSSTRKP